MKLSEFKKRLNELEVEMLLKYKLNDNEIDICVSMLTKELGDTCSDVEALYNSTFHKNLIVLAGQNLH